MNKEVLQWIQWWASSATVGYCTGSGRDDDCSLIILYVITYWLYICLALQISVDV